MNILDEQIVVEEREKLRAWRIAVRHIGYDVGRKGLQDREIIPLLHQMRRPTLFSRDWDFYERSLCHRRYCLVYLSVKKGEVAIFVRRCFVILTLTPKPSGWVRLFVSTIPAFPIGNCG